MKNVRDGYRLRKHPRRFYLAGKIQMHGWRESLVATNFDYGGYYDICADSSYAIPKIYMQNQYDFYVGPMIVGCDHGCYHGPNSHGSMDGCGGDVSPRYVYKYNRDAIFNCDVLFAWVDSLTCYGTLAEIGLARGSRGFGREIWIGFDSSLGTAINDLWFVAEMADRVLTRPSPVEAFNRLNEISHGEAL